MITYLPSYVGEQCANLLTWRSLFAEKVKQGAGND